jgi:hypothetical protein
MSEDPVWSAVGTVKPEFAVIYRQTCSRPRWWCWLSRRLFRHGHIVATLDLKDGYVAHLD